MRLGEGSIGYSETARMTAEDAPGSSRIVRGYILVIGSSVTAGLHQSWAYHRTVGSVQSAINVSLLPAVCLVVRHSPSNSAFDARPGQMLVCFMSVDSNVLQF
jgi:hypothetical protein